ncbi:ABC transporter substrate-binding protein [Sphingomonas mesophila]|uniref:ABC transporter substrate-binding protein n=1 Tax=Sphingomonas mesophila TaxID=2303576 RepID=UPI000E579CDD|nr:ABC transporter substrate-binding protein [Sphingomonas mesophila]
MPRAVLPLLALAAAALLAGCGRRDAQAIDVVIIGTAAPRLADPAAGPLGAPQQVALQNMAQGLVRFDSRGEIIPGLAERWNVSDDGLSYVFRLGSGKWPDGRDIRARDIVRLLKRQLRADSRNPLKDSLGAIEDVVAMTDRVIEIRLVAPRPNLLGLLAQPEFGLTRDGIGTGPFMLDADQPQPGWRALTYRKSVVDGPDVLERVRLRSAPAREAIALFADGKARLVLGGTFTDLPLARRAELKRTVLRFDPAAGLFGLVPRRTSGPLATPDARRLLGTALERQALVAALDVPGLAPRTSILQAGLEGLPPPPVAPPPPVDQAARRAFLTGEAARLFGDGERPTVRVRLPEGPGADLLLARLRADWGVLGLTVERATAGGPSDFVLLDAVAPTSSPAWFVRQFRCAVTPVCSKDADGLMDSGRLAIVAAQRAAFLAEAARLLDEQTAFIAIAAPIRWSLVDDRLPGFQENIVARHPLVGIDKQARRESD